MIGVKGSGNVGVGGGGAVVSGAGVGLEAWFGVSVSPLNLSLLGGAGDLVSRL